ncbi:MAG: aspartate aminotransferase family protein [Candidatus Latescibacterota bacterium]|nr:aspartate aminotransferase family protein [Candidatus Latescibacterota bacterium]
MNTDAIHRRYRERNSQSLQQFERDQQVLPGGAKGAYYYPPFPLTMERGEGCYLWDIDGHRYVDFASHHTAQMLGHGHPAVLEAIRQQLERGLALGAPMGTEALLAEEICCRVPSVEKVRFCNSGTEATLHAIRLARAHSGRTRIAKFEGGYHGQHDAVEISVAPPVDQAGSTEAPRAVPGGRGMSPAILDEILVLPYDNEGAVERLVADYRDELACIVVDPKAGIMPQRAEFIRAVEATARRHELLLIFDEIVGFGAGSGGMQGEYGITPDLSTYAKIVGGGLPVGAFGGRADLMDLLDGSKGRAGLFQSGTHSGHALVMTTGRITLEHLTSEAFAHLHQLAARLCEGLNDALVKRGWAPAVVRSGSVFSIYFADQVPRDYRTLAARQTELTNPVFLSLLKRGYYLSHALAMNCLSLPMQDQHVDGLVEAFGQVMDELCLHR